MNPHTPPTRRKKQPPSSAPLTKFYFLTLGYQTWSNATNTPTCSTGSSTCSWTGSCSCRCQRVYGCFQALTPSAATFLIIAICSVISLFNLTIVLVLFCFLKLLDKENYLIAYPLLTVWIGLMLYEATKPLFLFCSSRWIKYRWLIWGQWSAKTHIRLSISKCSAVNILLVECILKGCKELL